MGEKGYKGFNKGLVCREKQYAENTVFEEEKAEICRSGNASSLASSGYASSLASSGECSSLASSGECSSLASSGEYSSLASSGEYSSLASSGECSSLASSGRCSKLASSGEYSVIMCAGKNSIAKAKKGSFITLSEWEYSSEEGEYIPICVKTEKVDGERIKEDTFYKLENGEFVEV